MPHLPQICPVCKNQDNLYFIKAFTGVSNLIAKLTFVVFCPNGQKRSKMNFWTLLLSVANPVKVVISHIFAHRSKSGQNSFSTVLPRIVNLSKKSSYLCFSQCSKWGQIITSSLSLLSVANMIKIVVYHYFAQGSKFGQIPLYSQFCSGWQIWSKR